MIMQEIHNLRACCFHFATRPSGSLTQIKEERKSDLLTQAQEFLRIHRFVVMGDAEMHMAAQS